ncbi:MAG: ferrous iron transport protein B [Bacteroidales bacterium]|nr:ferrous iron transport protein B [Bacteroidales bacterium]
MTLNDLQTGDSAVIKRIHGTGAFRKRITEMGFVRGQHVTVVKSTPFKGPVEYRIMSGTVSLRRSEAMLIDVTVGVPRSEINAHLFQPIYTESREPSNGSVAQKKITVALVGNPNCGKTTLYNRLSRSNERVANYSGVTVGTAETSLTYKGYEISFTDLPGTYSLSAYSEDEVIVRDFLNKRRPDVVVNVVDGGNPERHMYLTTQLIDMGIQMVMALNMYDDLKARGDKLDIASLGRLIGIPIVPTIGRHGKGVFRLLNRIIQVVEEREPLVRHTHINYGEELEHSISRIESELGRYKEELEGQHIRYFAIRMIERDDYCMHVLARLPFFEEVRPVISEETNRLESLFREDTETLISNARYAFIAGALRETYKKGTRDRALSRTQKIDRVLTHKYFGFLIFLTILFGMFHATFSLGQYPMNWIEAGVDWLGSGISGLLPQGMVKDFLVDGIIGGVGGVIVFLPNILILFFIISLMEDTGYMARTAFIMDRVMHIFGLHGKSFIPMIMGFGCNVPAIMATRMLENKRDRILTMMIIPFMSCSARLPVYILIAGAVFPGQAGNIIFLMYLIGILFSIAMAFLLKSTLFRKSEAPFVMELPPYRAPGLKVVLKHMWFKGELYLKKMGGVILIASVIIWALGYFPRNVELTRDYETLIAKEEQKLEQQKAGEGTDPLAIHIAQPEISIGQIESQIVNYQVARDNEQQAGSFIGMLGHAIEPVIRPLGFDWKMGVSLLAGFAAKEVVVSTMGVLYQVSDAENQTVSLQQKLQEQRYTAGPKQGEKVYTRLSGFSFLLFVLLYLPCVSVIATVGRESGSWKWAALVVFYTTFLAWFTSFCVYQIGSLF